MTPAGVQSTRLKLENKAASRPNAFTIDDDVVGSCKVLEV